MPKAIRISLNRDAVELDFRLYQPGPNETEGTTGKYIAGAIVSLVATTVYLVPGDSITITEVEV